MKKFTRVLSLILALALCVGLMAGCGSSAPAVEKAPAATEKKDTAAPAEEEKPLLDTSKQVEIVMYCLGTEPAGQQAIWDELNAKLLEKLNCTLKVNYISFADYPNKYPLLFSSGEEFDMAYAAVWLNYPALAKKGAFMDVTEMWPTYAPNNYAQANDAAKLQAQIDGVTYCVPALNRTYSAYGPIYRMDLVKEYGFDKEIENFEDVEEYLDIIKEHYPEMQPISLYSMGSEMDDCFMYFNKMHPLKNSQNDFFWIDPSQENPQIFTYYEYEKTPEFLEMINRWNQKGFFPKSVLSDTESGKFKKNISPLLFHNSDSYLSSAIEHPEWDVRYTNFSRDVANMSFIQDAMVISNTSKNPERAMALWDYITTDEEAFDLFYYGIEGLSYELNDKNEISMINTDTYGMSTMWAVRNSNYIKNTAGTPDAYVQLRKQWDEEIAVSNGSQKYRAFVFDTAAIETEYTTCVNVHQQYWWPLELGYTDPVAGLEEYQKMMEAAGVEKVRTELQRQLDEYVAAMK